MDMKFFDSLCGGDSVKGVKLCLGLTEGDFWARQAGVQILYKGQSIDDVDFYDFHDVSNVHGQFELAGGQPLSRLFFVVRRTNCCGIEDKTINAALRVDFDSQGNLIQNGCNKIIDVSAQQVEGDKVKLMWFYHGINQSKMICKFQIYSDGGSGTIDFQNSIGTVEYTGRKFYQFLTPELNHDCYRFCIRAAAKETAGNEFCGEIKIWLTRQSPDGIGLIICQTI
jgi:hypothetical protein